MIKARNLSSHSYDPKIADAIATDICARFGPAFEQMSLTFARLSEKGET